MLAVSDVIQVADRGVASLLAGLRPIVPGRLCAPIWPCMCEPGDNLALHGAIATAPPGTALVCDAREDTTHGFFGDLMAAAAAIRSIRGIVITGSVRDVDGLTRQQFPVYGLGISPFSTLKARAVSVGEPISLLDVTMAPRDIVIADSDGVVHIPSSEWPCILDRAKAHQRKEEILLEQIARGHELHALLSLDSLATPPS